MLSLTSLFLAPFRGWTGSTREEKAEDYMDHLLHVNMIILYLYGYITENKQRYNAFSSNNFTSSK